MSIRYIGISVKKARVNILAVFVPDFGMCLNWSKTSKAALGVFQDSGHQSKCFRIWICLVKSFERMSMMLLLKNAGWRWLDVVGAAEVLNWVGECSLQVQQEHGTDHNSQPLWGTLASSASCLSRGRKRQKTRMLPCRKLICCWGSKRSCKRQTWAIGSKERSMFVSTKLGIDMDLG